MSRGLEDTAPPSTRRRALRYAALGCAAAAVLLFYSWAASPGRELFGEFSGGPSYYNYLIRGFRSGHLSLKADVPAGLLKLKDPYDPGQNAAFGLHDLSFYKGRLYLYFGVAPALAAYWPFAALTGHYLEDPQALFLFCAAAFLSGSFLLARVHGTYFRATGVAVEAGGVIAMGLATMVPVLLRRSQVYEVAVASGDAFFMVSLLGVYQAFHGGRKLAWLSLASLAYGMAIASRPSYVFGGVFLLVPVLAAGVCGPAPGAAPGRLPRAIAALAPVGLVVAGLLLYNKLRFDSPFEFGQRYELSGIDETRATHFSLSYLWYNCRAYLFAPANLSAYFPFVRVVSLPRAPAAHIGFEDPYGIIPNIPFAMLALLAPMACANRRKLGLFVTCAALASLGVAAVVFTFQFASNRYMVDFLPGFIVLSVIGFWGLADRLVGIKRSLAMGLCWVALAWSVLFNLFASFNHNELLRVDNPAVFRRLLHAFDTPRFLLDRATGRSYGPLELTVRFPAGRKGQLEPLVITGSEFLSDYLYVYYQSDDQIVFGFEHAGFGGNVSDPVPLDYRRPHVVTVDMPPLYPPIGDPYFDGVPGWKTEAFSSRLTVLLDGDPVFDDTAQQFFPAFRVRPSIGGGETGQGALGLRFTGEIVRVRLLERDWNAPERSNLVGPLVITLEFPAGVPGAREPLVSSGGAGRADVLVVDYLDSNHVAFALDHWGYGGPRSGPVEVKPGKRQVVEVWFGSFFPASMRPEGVPASVWSDAAGRLAVFLDKKPVLDVRTPFYEAPSETVAVGLNSIGASSCAAQFTGRIHGFHRARLK